MTIKRVGEAGVSEGKNTVTEGKLLFFKFAARRALQHREACLSGARDGKWRGKFRGIYGRGGDPMHGLPASRAGRQLRRFGLGAMLEAFAAQAAGRRDRGVGVERHCLIHNGALRRGEPNLAKRLRPGMNGRLT